MGKKQRQVKAEGLAAIPRKKVASSGDWQISERDLTSRAWLLQENGYLVLRYLAEDLAKELDSVLDGILRSLNARQKPGSNDHSDHRCAREPCPIAYRRFGQRWRPWNTAMISSRSLRTRYGMTYRVPGTTSSRVPDTRPGRPRFGNSPKRSTAASNVVAVRAAAPGFSRAI